MGVSAAVGAFSPGLLSVGKNSIKSGRAINALSKQLGSARTANRLGKLKGRIGGHKSKILDQVSTQAAFQGLKALGKSANNCGKK